jgi:hypothetical protein
MRSRLPSTLRSIAPRTALRASTTALLRRADARGHGGLSRGAALGASLGALAGSFRGVAAAAIGAALGAALGGLWGAADD